MAPVKMLKDNPREYGLFRDRIILASIVVAVLFLLLLVRLVKLQVVDYAHFQTLSENNRVKVVPIPPTRGLIFDRNGVILAQNVPSFSLELVPEEIADITNTIGRLREHVEISEDDEDRFYRLLGRTRRFDTIPLRTGLTDAEVARFSVNRHHFPGVDVKARLARDYPLGSLGSHAIGYVGHINEQELASVDQAVYRGTTYFGKTGVEEAYEAVLHGRVGYQHVETNAQGRVLRVLNHEPPKPGKDIYLSLDVSLQAVAEAAFEGESGALVALDPSTGEVLAFVSMPRFDPNLFVDGMRVNEYHRLFDSPERPLFNRALAGQYPPGSTVKPFFGLASLEFDTELAKGQTTCQGWYSLPNHQHRYRDWKRSGHGTVNLSQAISQSCDVYFYELALELGIDRMHDYMTAMGFGRQTRIDLSGENTGLMPSREWKRLARSEPWYPGETLITGIGQGFLLATPIQLAQATATLANGGVVIAPRMVAFSKDTKTNQNVSLLAPASLMPQLSKRHRESIVRAMVDVVHGTHGTARRIAENISYRIAGKTGTAQVFGVAQEDQYVTETVEKKLRDHALFVGFAPSDTPRIALSVVVENGGSGSRSAAPIARRVFDHYLWANQHNDDNQDELLVTSTVVRLQSNQFLLELD